MSLSRTTLARLSLGLAPLAVIGMAAGPAGAQKARNGSTPASCDVEDENGNTSQVPEGTRVGLFYCGSDGNWHFGTVILDHEASATVGGSTGGITGGGKGTRTGAAATRGGTLTSFSYSLTEAPRTRAAK